MEGTAIPSPTSVKGKLSVEAFARKTGLHTDKSFRKLVKPNQIWIVITINR